MKLEKGLFELTKEQEVASKMLYNGKVVKCLVVPYHTYNEIKFDSNFISNRIEMDYSENVFMFPEKELSEVQSRQFVSLIVNGKHQEVLIITASQNIILDMFDGCVRILTEFDTIVDCPAKTFAANIHTINCEILNNKSHQKNNEYGNKFHVEKVNKVLAEVSNKNDFTQTEYDKLMGLISRIGEPLVETRLKSILREKNIIDKDKHSEIEFLEREIERLKKLVR